MDISQLMKGTLEGCILKIISVKATYGYEIIRLLKEIGAVDVSEGTIYPLLIRLEKKGYVESEFRAAPLGPSRKYYSITTVGKQELNEFGRHWCKLNAMVTQILDFEGGSSNEK